MYEHVKAGCKHIPPSEQALQFQSGYYLNKPRMLSIHSTTFIVTVNRMQSNEVEILDAVLIYIQENPFFYLGHEHKFNVL